MTTPRPEALTALRDQHERGLVLAGIVIGALWFYAEASGS